MILLNRCQQETSIKNRYLNGINCLYCIDQLLDFVNYVAQHRRISKLIVVNVNNSTSNWFHKFVIAIFFKIVNMMDATRAMEHFHVPVMNKFLRIRWFITWSRNVFCLFPNNVVPRFKINSHNGPLLYQTSILHFDVWHSTIVASSSFGDISPKC